ncbi:MAG: hypothetical protein ACTSVZ_10115 [Promethearchaeota archaeon]
MAIQKEIDMSNGVKLSIDSTDLDKTYKDFIDLFIKPYYQQTNDWNKTLQISIKEIERISSVLQISKNEVIQDFLKHLETQLPTEIAELKGVNKIEILFESVDDYVQNISEIVKEGSSQADIRMKISALVENLNLFEIAELLIQFAKKSV